MNNLLAFLSRHRFFLLYLIFLVLSLILIYNNNYYHRSKVISTTGIINGKLNQVYEGFTGFFELRKSNERLASDNARLLNMLDALAYRVGDTLEPPPVNLSIRFISAKVISNSVHNRNNYFMLNKGWGAGIVRDMGVISPDGVIGIIIDATENYSTGISLLHKDSRVNGRILKNNQLVTVSWDGANYRFGTISHIPSHINLMQGDTVITSGNSQLFPEGIMIGTVEKINEDAENTFKSGKIRFSVDYNRLSYVYAVSNPGMKEIESLKTDQANE